MIVVYVEASNDPGATTATAKIKRLYEKRARECLVCGGEAWVLV